MNSEETRMREIRDVLDLALRMTESIQSLDAAKAGGRTIAAALYTCGRIHWNLNGFMRRHEGNHE